MPGEIDPKMDPEMQKKYGAYKVSEFTHGKDGYKIEDSIDKRSLQPDDTYLQQLDDEDVDYRKRYTLGDHKKNLKQEFKSTKDALRDLSPFQWHKQLKKIKSMTPEEYETMLSCLDYFKRNCLLYSSLFLAMSTSFTYWQRIFLPRGFWFFSGFFGIFAGCFFAALKTGRYGIERLDMLGNRYELSRLIKQDIFDTRPDIDSDIRALYYMQQSKDNEMFEAKMNRNNNRR